MLTPKHFKIVQNQGIASLPQFAKICVLEVKLQLRIHNIVEIQAESKLKPCEICLGSQSCALGFGLGFSRILVI